MEAHITSAYNDDLLNDKCETTHTIQTRVIQVLPEDSGGSSASGAEPSAEPPADPTCAAAFLRGKSNTIGQWSGLYLKLHVEALMKTVSPLVVTPYPSWTCPKI